MDEHERLILLRDHLRASTRKQGKVAEPNLPLPSPRVLVVCFLLMTMALLVIPKLSEASELTFYQGFHTDHKFDSYDGYNETNYVRILALTTDTGLTVGLGSMTNSFYKPSTIALAGYSDRFSFAPSFGYRLGVAALTGYQGTPQRTSVAGLLVMPIASLRVALYEVEPFTFGMSYNLMGTVEQVGFELSVGF